MTDIWEVETDASTYALSVVASAELGHGITHSLSVGGRLGATTVLAEEEARRMHDALLRSGYQSIISKL